jgi:hypothetical protein
VPTRSALEELNRRLGWAFPALAALAFGVFRLPELTRSPLWFDELFSLGVADLPIGDSLRRIIADHTNPPLFYLLLKGWMAAGGDSDHWVRLLPCLFAMLLGAALVWLAREARAGGHAGLLAVALAAASPLSVDLANEVRGYSLLALLACLSLAATLHDRARRTRGTFALLTGINIALVHTHYFGWLTVAAACLTASLAWPRDDARRVLRSALYTLLAFLPWAAAVLAHALQSAAPLRNVAWIMPPDIADPLWFVRDLTGRSGSAAVDLAWLALLGVSLIALAVRAVRQRPAALPPRPTAPARTDGPTPGAVALLAMAGFAMPVAVWAVSLVTGHSVWTQRYMMGAAAPVALLAGIAVAALPPKRWRFSAVVGFAWVAVACAALPQRAPVKFDWRRFTRRIDMAAGSPRDIFALEAFTAAPLQRYARAGMRVQMVHSLAELPSGDIWLVYRRQSFSSGSPADALRDLGFTTIASLAAETAGQNFVATRVRR